MTRTTRGRTNEITMEGHIQAVPGFETPSSRYADQMPMLLSGTVDLTSAVSDQLVAVMPFAGKILHRRFQFPTKPDANTNIRIGTKDDNDHFETYTATSAGLTDGDTATSAMSATGQNNEIDKGDVIVIGTSTGAPTAGVLDFALVIVPEVR